MMVEFDECPECGRGPMVQVDKDKPCMMLDSPGHMFEWVCSLCHGWVGWTSDVDEGVYDYCPCCGHKIDGWVSRSETIKWIQENGWSDSDES